MSSILLYTKDPSNHFHILFTKSEDGGLTPVELNSSATLFGEENYKKLIRAAKKAPKSHFISISPQMLPKNVELISPETIEQLVQSMRERSPCRFSHIFSQTFLQSAELFMKSLDELHG